MCCMNYEVFDALNAGTLCRAEDETEQAFMERVYRMLCEEEGAACVRFCREST